MRKLALRKTGKNLTLSEISLLEQNLGINIPSDYSQFLIENNGGDLHAYVRRTKEGYEFEISNFFRIDNTSFSLSNMFYAISEMFNNSNDWLPFGSDSGDYVFCICLKKDRSGHIYLMRTDEIEEDSAFIYICDSFNKFIEGLSTS